MARPTPASAASRSAPTSSSRTSVKDTRTGHETGNVQAVLDGDLDPFIRDYLLSLGRRKDRLAG